MKKNSQFQLNGSNLSREIVYKVSEKSIEVTISDTAKDAVEKARQYLEDKVKDNIIYGVNTGFGALANRRLNEKDLDKLQRNLIITHAVGVGKPLSEKIVRAMMLIRLNTFLKGHSGVRLQIVETLIDMLNKGVHPVIPEKGSVGASGDLAPLSHLALVLMGEGRATYEGKEQPGKDAMSKADISTVDLSFKEGLALNNGTTLMTAFTSLSLSRLEYLIKLADISACMSLEAVCGRSSAFDEKVHEARGQIGQKTTAKNIRLLINKYPENDNKNSLVDIDETYVPRDGGGWEMSNESIIGGKSIKPQDSYSLRCVPQVHGAVKDAFNHAANVVGIELNSATDNPLIFPTNSESDCNVISAGNFHGMPISLVCSYLKASIASLASISERRINKLVDPATNDGLPAFLIKNTDHTESGFMIVQYTAAALVNELATKSHPASVHSIPTCANSEDHVSMGANEARHVFEMLDDLSSVIALELLTASQALDIRIKSLAGKFWDNDNLQASKQKDLDRLMLHKQTAQKYYSMSLPINELYDYIRNNISYMENDRIMEEDVTKILNLVNSNELVNIVEKLTDENLDI